MTNHTEQTSTSYVAKKPDENGFINYDATENAVWHDLYKRQITIVHRYACSEYTQGLTTLNLTTDRIPQCSEINQKLQQTTGWQVEPVPALIPHDYFFKLLSQRKFPAATFIRRREEFNYIQEPDIFHEYFGHCPMLTNPIYADFMHAYGHLGLNTRNPQHQQLLARLYWFTVEFGLIQTPQGKLCYGGGILSSPEETVYAIDSDIPKRLAFNLLDVLRTPYRIDIKQPIYFVINDFEELYDLIRQDITQLLEQAIALGEFEPCYSL
ncbi:MAG: phenylalanine 4-monooxygenase [Gammaproteobacteria bacterium]